MNGGPADVRDRLDTLSPEQKRALLAQLLQQRQQQKERCFPMSFSQQRLWFLDQLSPGNPFYNVESAIPLGGPLDVEALRRATNEVVRRHEVLRTTFRMVEGEPVQAVLPELEIELPIIDLRSLPPAERESEVSRRRVEEATRPFDLAAGPLLRTTLLRLEHSRYLFLLGMHHIVSDGWSMGVFGREMGALYTSFVLGKPCSLPELPLQYGDFAVWQRKWLAGETLEQQLCYWRAQLEGLAGLELPTDRPRPPVQTFRGAFHNVTLPKPLADALNRLSRHEGVTLFMTLLAAFQLLLYRYSGQEDVAVGTYIAGRNRAEIEPLIGFFLNTLVLRTRLDEQLTVRGLLQRVREVCLGAYAHQDLPFEKLVEELHPDRDLSRNPLFQVTFQMTNAPNQKPIDDPEAALDFKRGTAIFDLAFMVFETRKGISGQFEYSTDLFEAATIERMAGHFRVLLEAMVEDPDSLIVDLPLLTDAEQRRILVEWNATGRHHGGERDLVELFEAAVERSGDRVAFTCEGKSLSYRELDGEANRIARHLIAGGVTPGTVVALCLERSLQMVAALLGLLKAGAVYLPLDPAYPSERLVYMLTDARAEVLLTNAPWAKLFPGFAGRLITLDGEREAIANQPDRRPGIRRGSDELAYVIYTSGSTGRPKGVAAPHRQILNRLEWMWREYPFLPGEVACQKTALSFVDSLWELFGPLLRGVPSVFVPDRVVRDPDALVRELALHGVSRLWLVPSLLRGLLDHVPDLQRRLPALTFWVSSGEALTPELLQRFQGAMPDAVLFNLYGTSEVWDVTWYDPRSADGALWRVPIGTPIDNLRVYVLDPRGRPVPVGVPGELFVAGDGLCDGYLHHPESTAERFLPLSLASAIEETAYRTGDQVRFLADGNLEYLGRLDQQLKVRGYRVEPAEIEDALVQHSAVRQAAVVPEPGDGADTRLIAYVVPIGSGEPGTEELRRFLLDRLPQHMVPARFVAIEALPLTPSGKLDRGALGRWTTDRPELERAYVAPRPGMEETLARIWSQVLRIERIGAHDHFFDLGGHSLLATQVMSRLNAELEVEVPLRQLFETPTVAGMALAVEQARGGNGAQRPTRIARLDREQYRMEIPTAP